MHGMKANPVFGFIRFDPLHPGLIFFDYQPASAPRTGLVEGRVLVELKAVKAIEDIHIAQALNYLKATELLLKTTTEYSQNEIHHGF